MSNEVWVQAKIYGIDLYEDFTPRITVPGDGGDAGPIDELFDPDDFIVSQSIALANGRFYGAALVKGEEKDGMIRVRGALVGKAGTDAGPDLKNGSLPVVDERGEIVSRCVDSREKALKWADQESETGSVVIRKKDIDEHDCKNQAVIRKDAETYALRRSVIDRINGMHHTDAPKM